MSITVYDLNGHLHLRHPRPAGVMLATIKTPFVAATHKTARTLLHRPEYAVTADVQNRRGTGSRIRLAARFLCGSGSESVIPVASALDDANLCAKCERRSADAVDAWTVYGYFAADGEALYVGQTIDLASRHRSHSTDRRSGSWFGDYHELRVLGVYDSRRLALAAEREQIITLLPRFNIQHNVRGIA